MTKINVNSWARDPYAKALAEGLLSGPFPEAVEHATETCAKAIERFMILFKSSGKA